MKRIRQTNDQVFNRDDMQSFLEKTLLQAAGW